MYTLPSGDIVVQTYRGVGQVYKFYTYRDRNCLQTLEYSHQNITYN